MPRKGQLRPKSSEEGNNRNDPLKCPICSFQVIAIARGDGYEGNGYNICPKCYCDLPAEFGGGSNNGGTRNHPCFSCSHPTCALAGGTQGGDVEVFACPFCKEKNVPGGKVALKKNTRGYVLSCSNYAARQRCGFTIWLPRPSRSVEVRPGDEHICTACSTHSPVRKLSFVWKQGDVPPHLGRESTVCLLCDTRFRQDLQIQLPQMDRVGTNHRNRRNSAPRVSSANNAPGGNGSAFRGRRGAAGNTSSNYNNNGGVWGNNASSNNNGRNNNGAANNTVNNRMVCFRCNQPGHFANACPTRHQ